MGLFVTRTREAKGREMEKDVLGNVLYTYEELTLEQKLRWMLFAKKRMKEMEAELRKQKRLPMLMRWD